MHIDGYLYGNYENLIQRNEANLTFIYPDLSTGLQGYFVNRKFIEGEEIAVIGNNIMLVVTLPNQALIGQPKLNKLRKLLDTLFYKCIKNVV